MHMLRTEIQRDSTKGVVTKVMRVGTGGHSQNRCEWYEFRKGYGVMATQRAYAEIWVRIPISQLQQQNLNGEELHA